jgi:hypothetical protein
MVEGLGRASKTLPSVGNQHALLASLEASS